jgi:hypothetical protein
MYKRWLLSGFDAVAAESYRLEGLMVLLFRGSTISRMDHWCLKWQHPQNPTSGAAFVRNRLSPGGVVITPVAVAFLTGKRIDTARGSIPSPNSKFCGFCKTLFRVLNTVIQKYRLTAVHNSRTKYINLKSLAGFS